jgi:hypothetical protein
VAGVGLGDRRDPVRDLPGQQRDARRLLQLRRVDAQLDRQLFVEREQLGSGAGAALHGRERPGTSRA